MFRMNGIRLSLVVSILAAIVLAACGGGSTPAPPAEQVTPAAEASPVSAGSSGQADLGFRPGVNGFGFENYGNDVGPTNLTPVEMRRMFGDQVCARIQDDTCTLTPVAGQWMQQTNDAMSGGHCEGFAALSLLMYTSQVSAADFGGSTAHDLALPNNDPLQREIAYWWATQGTRPTSQDEIKRTPNEIVDILTEAFKADAKAQDTYTVGIFKRDMTGGHAITPYAVVDNGDGTVSIMVYDNNWPDQERQIIVDRTANTWKYEASINPDEPAALYEGDADTFTLSLTPTSARLGQQACDFCADGAASRAGGLAAQPAPANTQVWLDGDGDLLITDEQGRRLGYDEGKFVNEIPDSYFVPFKSDDLWKDTREPLYFLPQGIVNLTIDGTRLTQDSATDLILFGPGYDLGVEGIGLSPGQKDNLTIPPAEGLFPYQPESDASPNLIFALTLAGADSSFGVTPLDIICVGSINAALDVKAGDLLINASDLRQDGTFSLVMTRYDDNGEQTFYHDGLALKSGGSIYIYFAEWKGDGTDVLIGVDTNGDGNIDDTYSAIDQPQ